MEYHAGLEGIWQIITMCIESDFRIEVNWNRLTRSNYCFLVYCGHFVIQSYFSKMIYPITNSESTSSPHSLTYELTYYLICRCTDSKLKASCGRTVFTGWTEVRCPQPPGWSTYAQPCLFISNVTSQTDPLPINNLMGNLSLHTISNNLFVIDST